MAWLRRCRLVWLGISSGVKRGESLIIRLSYTSSLLADINIFRLPLESTDGSDGVDSGQRRPANPSLVRQSGEASSQAGRRHVQKGDGTQDFHRRRQD